MLLLPASGLWLLLAPLLTACSIGGGASEGAGEASATRRAIGDFPDPFVLVDADTAYAYATNGQGRHVQLLTGRVRERADRIAWTAMPDAMPVLAPWVQSGFTWAPEVARIGARWRLYYTARHRRTGRQCIGVAVAAAPTGPFADAADEPLLCQAPDGTIDASPFVGADGRVVLHVKSDGNCCGRATTLFAQPLSADGMALAGPAVPLLTNDPAGWEGRVVEAPTMWRHAGRHWLFYSANDFAGAAYAVGHAECDGPLGPCRRPVPSQALLRSRADATPPLVGPGHQALFRIGAQTWIAYHAWQVTEDGRRGNARLLHIDRLDWVDGRPVVVSGSTRVP